MATWQAHLVDVLYRGFVKPRFKRVRTLKQTRALMNGGGLPSPDRVIYQDATLGGIPGEWVRPKWPTGPSVTLLYLHGGGYIGCSAPTHRPITASLANLGFDVFTPNYRLAPEHPFPAAVDDAEAAWNDLPAATVLAGDSAGGGLALALMIRLRDKAGRLPVAAALFSPWTDLAVTGESVRSNSGRDAALWAPGIATVAGWYLGGADPRTPEASPLYADLTGLPPLLIDVGDRETLRDDSTRLAERAIAAGVSTTLTVWPVVPHVWQMVARFLPEARQSLAGAAAFLHKHSPKPPVDC